MFVFATPQFEWFKTMLTLLREWENYPIKHSMPILFLNPFKHVVFYSPCFLTRHRCIHLTFHAASTYGFCDFYLSLKPFLLNNQENHSLATPILTIPLSNMWFLHPMLLPMYKAFYLQSMPHQLRFFVRPSFINHKMVQTCMPCL